ncbi:helix-turn-helix transcriptional regulator [Terasakiella sp. A23]|uniref:helix-turn-helix domain-containing protein n=1 Tax=Terasakiella sp. FCG-A23 TaxID=3080561 RepID=UPI002955135E|nr:helix-turn-helix transcriptional regulator [Terasakiella sp. A23]MDV7341004.1 helix-turn-helix transcriptional regulator [Terasakiella sp. A23]
MQALDIAKKEVDAYNAANDGRGGVKVVADKIGVPRSSLSAFLNGSYPGKTDNIEDKILRALVGRVNCPHQGTDIAQDDCADLSSRDMPMSGKHAIRQWKACQGCPHKLKGGDNA